MDKKNQLERISHYAGIRFDLVQAGGGNSSVKLNQQEMLVKASGTNLSQVTAKKGHVGVDYQQTRLWFQKNDLVGLNKKEREIEGNKLLSSVTMSNTGQPSIETFLHALLNTYTLHTHPISVNAIAAQENWKALFAQIFPEAICVDYETPGIDLALNLYNEIKQRENLPKIVFLQNHGLIISSESADEVIELSNSVTDKLNKIIDLDLTRYQNITHLHNMVSADWDTPPVIHCCDDTVIKELISIENKALDIWPFCPDTLIYCGVAPVFISSFNDTGPLQDYIQRYSSPPKIIIVNEQVYFIASSLKKTRESEELLKFHLLSISKVTTAINRLSIDEIAYLSNWDAEKYRQGV